MSETREFKSFLKTVAGNEGNKCHYNTRLDMYGCGCAHDCKYCYAKSLLDFRRLWNPALPAVADFMKIHRAIAYKLSKTGETVRLGGMTDCFQPVELRRRVTYRTIQELNKYRVPYLIVTKSATVANNEYLEILDKELAHVQISITCTDDDFCRSYEKASVPSERIKAVEKLYDSGIDVAVRLSPFIPQFVGGVLNMQTINEIRCDKILVEFLRVNAWIKKWFDIDYSEYTVKQSGYLHMPLDVKKEYMKLITGFEQVSVCEDESEAWSYWKDNFNPDPDDCCNLRKKAKQ